MINDSQIQTNSSAGHQISASNSSKLGTREHAVQRMAMELGRVDADQSHQFSIVMVEFEGLSLATDHLGDASANDLLRTVVGMLKQDLNVNDQCYRLGGDEFLLILPKKGEADCRTSVDRLSRCLIGEATTRRAGIDVSIGFASTSAEGATIQGLFAAADQTMHAIKPETPPARGIASAAARDTSRPGVGFFGHRNPAFANA